MLTLTRRKNERIIINDDIIVTVTFIDDITVSLGVTTDKFVRVHRKEVRDKILLNEKRKRNYEKDDDNRIGEHVNRRGICCPRDTEEES